MLLNGPDVLLFYMFCYQRLDNRQEKEAIWLVSAVRGED